MELMVVVVLVSILAMIATPAMRVARDDRLAFDYARRIEQMVHRARARAAGRGAAHLFVAGVSGVRGRFLLFEALDGTLATAAGPNPVSTCKAVGEWTDAGTFVPGAVSLTASIIEGLDLDATGVNADMDLRTTFAVNGAAAATVVMCVTPNGSTYVGSGTSIDTAVAAMQATVVPFNTFLDIAITRNKGGAPIGLQRHVLVAGGAAPRIHSL